MTADLFACTLSGEIMMYGLSLLEGRGDPRPPFDQSGPRQRRVRAALGLTQKEFGRALGGLAWHRVRDLESGKACLHPRLAWVIEQKFKVDFRWLLTGEGPIHLDKRDDAKGAQ